jgi:MurE/MurF fusion protein
MYIGDYFKKINLKYKKHYFSGISFNSIECKRNNIFFAIKGSKIDGNKFINEAIKKGAKTIVSDKKLEGFKNNILYIRSKNVRKLLSQTSYKITKYKPKNLVAVTGTNGKSSIVNFYLQILRLNKIKAASIGTLGVDMDGSKKKVSNTTLNPIELSLYLKRIKKKKIENVILEASSHGLKQHRLDGLKFKIGIFTNLSHDHLDYHKNFKDYLKSKLYLFEKLLEKKSTVITDFQIQQYKKIKDITLKKKLILKTISTNKKGNLEILSHKYFLDKQSIKIRYKDKTYKFNTNLIGKIQIKNILMAMIASEKSGLSFKRIVNKIHSVKPVNGRLEKVGVVKNNSKVILDYAHTPDALRICLENLKKQFKDKKISIVFGCGGNRDQSKRSIMGKIANTLCDRVYLTDDNPRHENPKKIRSEIKKKINKSKLYEVPNRSKAIEKAIFNLETGDILLVAGKGHENIQDFGKIKKLFSDRKEILKNIKKKNKNLSKDFKLNILNEINSSNNISLKTKIRNGSFNSKEIKKGDVFFAIKGKNKNGNEFVQEAFKKGASLGVVSKLKKTPKLIVVDDTLKFLTKVSTRIRNNTSSKIIAITGSCGKTSLKELVGKTLNKISKTTYSPRSFNNKLGVPLSLFNLKQNDEFGIFEIGMDKKGEIDNLSKIIKPDVGVITNISYAHAKNFQNIKQIARAKSEIIRNIKNGGSLVLNADDKFYNFHKKIAKRNKLKVYSFSLKKKSAEVSLNFIKKEKSKYKIYININNSKFHFYINSNFENKIQNILATLTILSIFKNVEKIDKNIFYNHKTPDGRGDISKINIYKKFFYLIDESYNSNPLSLRSALKNFDTMKLNHSKKHLILGDMLELGKHSKRLHKEISKIINNTSINTVNVIGKNIRYAYENLDKSKKGKIINRSSQIIDLIKNKINNNDYLMIKGSNSTGLYKISNNLKSGKINAL